MTRKMLLILVFLILAPILIYRFFVFNPSNLQITKKEIYFSNLPEFLDGAKILHLSDFHSWWFGKREKKVLKFTQNLNPDFIFITGDFVDFQTSFFDKNLTSLKKFWGRLSQKFPQRVFGVPGNHDNFFVLKALNECGIEILINASKKISFKNGYFYLIGVDDPWTKRDNLKKAMSKANKENSFKILLSHSPDIISKAKEEKIDLILAGHLHGGQITLPFFGPLWVPSRYGSKYLKGLFKENSTYLYVNSGVGTSILPLRINSSPEISLIILKRYEN
jgi:predicted MPP superfamily phosphohydrolase